MAGSHHISRRDFVKLSTAALGTIMGAAVGLPLIGYVIGPALRKNETDTWRALGSLEDYEINVPTLVTFTRSKVNGWEKSVNSYGVFVIRTSEDEATVLSNVCTHLSCRVNWDEAAQMYLCPCHDAQFSLNGEVLGGPPPRPMMAYETKIEDGILSIHLKG